ncbi:hypothetical protein M0804_007497 [Polistes exclamans]|nr:hypothetical protein M0804_007497 [Polistes exclamans]
MWQRYKITYLYTLSGIRTSPRFNATKRVDVGGAVAVGVGGVDIGQRRFTHRRSSSSSHRSHRSRSHGSQHCKGRISSTHLNTKGVGVDDFVSLRDQKLGTHIKRATLPDNWIIPETVQKRSFRDPWKMIRKDLLLVKVKEKPTNNLDPNPKEREILRVKTGKSEYEDAIGKTGILIMKEKTFGPSLPIEASAILNTKNNSSKKSECSIILTSKNVALSSNIF